MTVNTTTSPAVAAEPAPADPVTMSTAAALLAEFTTERIRAVPELASIVPAMGWVLRHDPAFNKVRTLGGSR